MSKTPYTDRKVAHAEFHLGRLKQENVKMIGRDSLAIEADLTACLGAIKSALNRLWKEVGAATYNRRLSAWKGTLSQVERRRFNRMRELRNLDVHEKDIETSVKQTAVPAIMVPGVTSWFVPGEAMLPNPDPQGTPAYAPAWVYGQQIQLEAADAATTCEKYLDLLRRFVKEFQ